MHVTNGPWDATSGVRRMMVAAIVVGAGLSGAAAGRLTGGTIAVSQGEARSAQAAGSVDVLPALLVEVKGLRAAMEQFGSAGPSVQLAVARLQMEESRIAAMTRRLDVVRERLGAAQKALTDKDEQQAAFEKHLAEDPGAPGHDEMVHLIAQLKLEAAAARTTLAGATAEEAQLTQDITAEQARWTQISQRLDDLERALTRR